MSSICLQLTAHRKSVSI